MQEEWKFYKETYNRRWGKRIYEVSNFGRVKVNGKIKELKLPKNGYIQFMYSTYLHRVVAELFIPNLENKPCVEHLDTNKFNNHINNLRWATYSENNSNPITRERRNKSLTGQIRGPHSEIAKQHMRKPHPNYKRRKTK